MNGLMGDDTFRGYLSPPVVSVMYLTRQGSGCSLYSPGSLTRSIETGEITQTQNLSNCRGELVVGYVFLINRFDKTLNLRAF